MRRIFALLALLGMGWSHAAMLHCAVRMHPADAGGLGSSEQHHHAGPLPIGGPEAEGVTRGESRLPAHAAAQTPGPRSAHDRSGSDRPAGCLWMTPCGTAMMGAVASHPAVEVGLASVEAFGRPTQAIALSLPTAEPPPPRASV